VVVKKIMAIRARKAQRRQAFASCAGEGCRPEACEQTIYNNTGGKRESGSILIESRAVRAGSPNTHANALTVRKIP
jgi:hypothetical protein